MATVTVNYSQQLVFALAWSASRTSTDELADIASFAKFLSQTTQMGTSPNVFPEIQGTSLRAVSIGGYSEIEYKGLVPSALGSTASATRFSMRGVTLEQQGQFNLQYTSPGSASRIQQIEGVASSGTIGATYKQDDLDYDDEFGNVRVNFTGALRTGTDGSTSGFINQLTVTSEKLLKQTVAEGDFTVVADSTSHYASVSGTLTRYESSYQDGSIESIIGPIHITASPNLKLIENGANFAGDDVFDVRMPTLSAPKTIQTGAGNDLVTLAGGGGMLHLATGSGNDTIKVLGDSHQISAGEGVDTVALWGKQEEFTKTDDGITQAYIHRDGSIVTMTGVERVEFSGIRLSHDIAGNAGQAYRVYKAAFDRAPDAGGLGFWIDTLDHGQTLAQVASGFLGSPEYVSRYGAGISDKAFINNLYHNVLHRDADADGASYWDGRIANGASRAQVLVEFSESRENQAQVIGAIQNGIDYLPF
jgi:hypothetical protein